MVLRIIYFYICLCKDSSTIIRTFGVRRRLCAKLAHLVLQWKAPSGQILPLIILAMACIKLIIMTMQPKAMHA
jgi:hypothetical protein